MTTRTNDLPTMRWFGDPWGAPINEDCPRVAAPVGCNCQWCNEKVQATETGVIYSNGPACHLECFLRQSFGSVGHQLGLCICFGGPGWLDDPPNLTKREAAVAAVAWFRTHRK